MRKVKNAAVYLANSSVCVFIFFQVPYFKDIFPEIYIAVINQVMVGCMAVSIFVAPNEIIEMGRKIAPRIKAILDIVMGRGNGNKNKVD